MQGANPRDWNLNTYSMKSKYFGYTLRGAGTPYQQWIVSELPLSAEGIYTTSSTSEVTAGSIFPIQTIVLNQVGAKVNANGSISLPQGLYRIDYSGIVSTSAANPVKIDLVSNSSTISEYQGYTNASSAGTYTTTMSNSAIVKTCGCANVSLVNNSAVSVTPVSAGSESIRVFITRLL